MPPYLFRGFIAALSLWLLISILGTDYVPSVLIHPFTSVPSKGASCNTPGPGLKATSDEFRLVEIHRAGVGPKRNQVYQTLSIPASSPLHAVSPLSNNDDDTNNNNKYIITSIPGRTTHLSNQTRQSTYDYLARSRYLIQSLRDNPLSISPQSPAAEWTTRDILTPNITNKHSVLTMAKVASNAYIRIPDTEDWYDLGHKWNGSTDFGWEENGLRGHVFANSDNSTIIVAMKGTSPPFVGGSDTSTNDKINVPPFNPPPFFRSSPPYSPPLLCCAGCANDRTISYSHVAVQEYPTSGTQSAIATPAKPTNATKPV
jgi:putative lipase involved disintegration of autophagic bodies